MKSRMKTLILSLGALAALTTPIHLFAQQGSP